MTMLTRGHSQKPHQRLESTSARHLQGEGHTALGLGELAIVMCSRPLDSTKLADVQSCDDGDDLHC